MRVFLSKAERRRYYRNFRIKAYLFAGILLLIGVAVLYAIFNLPFLKIKHFDVNEGVDLESAQIEVLKSEVARLLGVENFLSWPSKLGKNVEVDKDFFTGTLELVGNFPEKFAIWCSQGCHWLDRKGMVLGPAPDTEGSSIPKIEDLGETALVIEQPVLAEELFANIVKILDGLGNLPLRIKGFKFNERLQELIANGTRGERLIFSARFTPPAKSFNYLRDLALAGDLRNAEYVDLTVENRIYLKSR